MTKVQGWHVLNHQFICAQCGQTGMSSVKGEYMCSCGYINEHVSYHDGQITRPGCRWCSNCGREHGASFVCKSASEAYKSAVALYETISRQLDEGLAGNGISELVLSRATR